jgi:hypothetical protein
MGEYSDGADREAPALDIGKYEAIAGIEDSE